MSTLDNPIQENQVAPIFPVASRHGIIAGLALIVLGLVNHLAGFADPVNPNILASALTGILSYGIMIGAVVMAVKAYRKAAGGFIPFGKAFGVGFMTMLVLTILTTIWQVIFTTVIIPDFYSNMLDATQQAMEAQGADDNAIDMIMGWYEVIFSPVWFPIIGLFSSLFMGAIIALIVGAILKKDPPQTV